MGLRFLWVLLVGLSFSWGQSVKAENRVCQPYCKQVIASNPQWQSYTPRQRAISTAVAHIITTYHAHTAQPLPVTPETVVLVVKSIEADPIEIEFVCQQMYEYSSLPVVFHTADARLEHLHQQIQTPQNSYLH